jgi:hypothetical protein
MADIQDIIVGAGASAGGTFVLGHQLCGIEGGVCMTRGGDVKNSFRVHT